MQRSGGGRSERRGQVILVAAIGIALTLITMGMVLSAVALPQQWWSAENVESVDSVQTTHAVNEGYAAAMFYTNFDNCLGRTNLPAAFADSGANWRSWFARLHNEDGRTVNTTVHSTTMGTMIKQRHQGEFRSKGGKENWTLVSDADARRFKMNISRSSLAHVTGPVTLSTLESSDAFHVTLANSTTRHIYVYYDTSNGKATISVTNQTAVVSNIPVTESYVLMDLTEGTVNGERHPNFTRIAPPYTISYQNGANASGRYQLVVDVTESNIDDRSAKYYNECGPKTPCTETAIYSAVVGYDAASNRVAYRTNVTIEPEDPELRFGGCDIRHGVVFVDEDNATLSTIHGINESPTIHMGPGFDPDGLGPILADIDRSGGKDIPFVDDSVLKMIDSTDEKPVTLTEQAQQIPVAVGDLDQDGIPMVFYKKGGDIYKIGHPGPPIPVYTGEKKPSGIGGIGDIDGDGKPAVVFLVESDKNIYYYEHNGTIQKIPGLVNEGQAIGQPADFDGDGKAKIPVVRDGDIWLYGTAGATELNESFSDAMGEPMATVDIDHDLRREIVFVAQIGGEGRLYYIEVVGSEKGLIEPVPKAGGNMIPAHRDEGAK